jgi:hypothetical protein
MVLSLLELQKDMGSARGAQQEQPPQMDTGAYPAILAFGRTLGLVSAQPAQLASTLSLLHLFPMATLPLLLEKLFSSHFSV